MFIKNEIAFLLLLQNIPKLRLYFCSHNLKCIMIMALQEEFELQGNWLFRRRSLLPLVVLLAGVAVSVFTIRMRGMWFTSVFPYWQVYEYLCLVVGLVGMFVRFYTVGHTPVGTSGRNTQGQVADVLNTTGIYSTVRHPLYLGNFLMWLGIALLTCNAGFIATFILAYWLYYERIMYAEEQFLRRKFGDTYLRWAERTPSFIPSFKRFRPTDLPFSWKKVVKKEKNGVFALFLLFSLFDGIVAWQAGVSPNFALLALTAASGIGYLILKYVKKHTRLLDERGR